MRYGKHGKSLMRQSADQIIDAGQMLPQFTLPAAGGRVVRLWEYKQREQIVLFILHGTECAECRRVLEDYAACYPAFREQETQLLALFPAPLEAVERLQQELQLPFPLLADAAGGTIRKLTLWDEARNQPQPALLVADRYGALYASYMAEHEDEWPSPDLVLRDLEYIAIQCPE